MVNSPILLFALGVFPAVFWLLFFLLESRRHPEPPKIIARVFIAGAIAAVFAAAIQFILQLKLFPSMGYSSVSLTGFIIFAFVEETVKFGGAYLAFKDRRRPEAPLDDMIYLITAAMGFAALENVLFLVSSDSSIVFQTAIMRSIGATFLHAVASGFTGFYLARGRWPQGLIVATVIHSAFNYLAYYFPEYQAYSVVLVILASFFLFHDFDIIKANDNGERET